MVVIGLCHSHMIVDVIGPCDYHMAVMALIGPCDYHMVEVIID